MNDTAETSYRAEIKKLYTQIQDFYLAEIDAAGRGCESFDDRARFQVEDAHTRNPMDNKATELLRITTNTNIDALKDKSWGFMECHKLVKKLADQLKTKGFVVEFTDQERIHGSGPGAYGESRPKITFDAPNTFETVQKLQAIYYSLVTDKACSLIKDARAQAEQFVTEKLGDGELAQKAKADLWNVTIAPQARAK